MKGFYLLFSKLVTLDFRRFDWLSEEFSQIQPIKTAEIKCHQFGKKKGKTLHPVGAYMDKTKPLTMYESKFIINLNSISFFLKLSYVIKNFSTRWANKIDTHFEFLNFRISNRHKIIERESIIIAYFHCDDFRNHFHTVKLQYFTYCTTVTVESDTFNF